MRQDAPPKKLDFSLSAIDLNWHLGVCEIADYESELKISLTGWVQYSALFVKREEKVISKVAP